MKLPEGIGEIGGYTFYECESLTEMTLPETVASIGVAAFYGNVSLESVNIPSGVPGIPYEAFAGCAKLARILLPESVTYIGDSAFSGCSGITEIEVPDSVTTIGEAAFQGTRVARMTLPFVGRSAEPAEGSFGYQNVFGYIFGYEKKYSSSADGVKSSANGKVYQWTYDKGASYSPATGRYVGYNYYIPDTLREVELTRATTLSANAFYGCANLTRITVNGEVSGIGEKAFYNCRSLASLYIPDSIQSIGINVLGNCSDLIIYANKDTEGYAYATKNNITVRSTKQIELEQKELVLYKDDVVPLSARVTMLNGKEDPSPKITWISADPSVATISNGMLTVTGPGTTTILADIDDKVAICGLTVFYKLESISFENDTEEVDIGTDKQLDIVFFPENTTDSKHISWNSSDESVVTVSDSGVISGIKKGTATIVASSDTGLETEIEVRVLVPAIDVRLDQTNLVLEKGETKQLSATIWPSDSTDLCSWTSSDEDIVSTDNEGNIEAAKSGTARITVATTSGQTDTCNVRVIVPASDVNISSNVKSIMQDKSADLSAVMLPADSTDRIAWSSSDENIAAVDQNGRVSARHAGNVTITATADSGASDQIEIEVLPAYHVSGILIEEKSI